MPGASGVLEAPSLTLIFLYILIFQVLDVGRLFYSIQLIFFVNDHFAFHRCFVFNGNYS